MNASSSRPSTHQRQLQHLQLLRQEAHRALWQGRVLQLLTLMGLLALLGAILNHTWPVETAETVEQAREWLSSLIPHP